MIKNHIIKKIMLYFKSLLLNEWPTFRIYRFLFRIWHVLKLLKTHISLENFVMIFLTLLPLKLNTLAENGPYHSWEALVESMGSEVPSTVLFSEGLRPSENSTVEGTEGP